MAMWLPPLLYHLFAHKSDLGIHVRRGQGELESVLGKPDIVRGDNAVAILAHPLPAPLQVCPGAEGIALCRDVGDPLRPVIDHRGQYRGDGVVLEYRTSGRINPKRCRGFPRRARQTGGL